MNRLALILGIFMGGMVVVIASSLYHREPDAETGWRDLERVDAV